MQNHTAQAEVRSHHCWPSRSTALVARSSENRVQCVCWSYTTQHQPTSPKCTHQCLHLSTQVISALQHMAIWQYLLQNKRDMDNDVLLFLVPLCATHCHQLCVIHHWHWLSSVRSWRLCHSAELTKHCH